MLNVLQRTDGLEGSRSPINIPQRQGHIFPLSFLAFNSGEIQYKTENSLELLEIRIITLPRRSFNHSWYHATHLTHLRHFPFPIPAAYLLHIAPELPDILGHGGGNSA